MAKVYRNTTPELAPLIADFNALKAVAGAGTSFHLDQSEQTVTAANSTDLPSAILLLQQCMGVYNFHIADKLAHQAADTTNTLAYTPDSVIDLTTAVAAANDLKAKFNSHLAQAGVHYNDDSTNAIATADATILSSLETLVNATKSHLNAHMASGPATASKRLVGA